MAQARGIVLTLAGIGAVLGVAAVVGWGLYGAPGTYAPAPEVPGEVARPPTRPTHAFDPPDEAEPDEITAAHQALAHATQGHALRCSLEQIGARDRLELPNGQPTTLRLGWLEAVVSESPGDALLHGPRGLVGQVRWSPGDDGDVCVLDSPREVGLEGTLLYSSGQPAAGVLLTSLCATDHKPVRTDDLGQFWLDLLAPVGARCRVEALLLSEGRTLGVETPRLEDDTVTAILSLPPASNTISFEQHLNNAEALAAHQLDAARADLERRSAFWIVADQADESKPRLDVLRQWREEALEPSRRRIAKLEAQLER